MSRHEEALQLRDTEFDAEGRAGLCIEAGTGGIETKKYEKGRIKLILEVLSRGGSRKLACMAGGITAAGLHSWMGRFPEFVRHVEAAEAAAYGFVMDKLTWNIDKGNIAAIIFWLKNRHPDEWQDKPLVSDGELVPQLTIEFPDGKKVTLDAKRLAKKEQENELQKPEYNYKTPPTVIDATQIGEGDK